MSTISVNYINGLGEAALRPVSGVAAYWIDFDGGNSGSPSVLDSVNSSSFTDDGTGAFTFSLSSAISTTSYSLTCGATISTRNASNYGWWSTEYGIRTSSTYKIRQHNAPYTLTDCFSCQAIHGDLA